MINISQSDKETLRGLAHKYMEIATLPLQRKKMELWKSLNRLDNTRPMITIEQLPWHELNYDGSLTLMCEDPQLKRIEDRLRKTIYKWNNFPVDMVVEPYFTIPFVASNTGQGIESIENVATTDSNNNVVSHAYINQFETDEDLDKITPLKVSLDNEKSKEDLDIANEIFGGIMPIKQAGGVYLRLQVWDLLAELMSVEQIYLDIYDRPEYMHELMARLTNNLISGIEQCNALGLFNTSANECHCTHTYTDELLPDFGAGISNDSYHSWGFGMAQLFGFVSPTITKEFEIDYMKKIAPYYGMFYYGCCERLDDRLDIVQEIKNIKKISCSPWSNPENFASKLDPKIILSNKPTPAVFASTTLDENAVKAHIQNICDIGKNHDIRVEFLLKDLSTVSYKPENIKRWADIAMGVVENL